MPMGGKIIPAIEECGFGRDPLSVCWTRKFPGEVSIPREWLPRWAMRINPLIDTTSAGLLMEIDFLDLPVAQGKSAMEWLRYEFGAPTVERSEGLSYQVAIWELPGISIVAVCDWACSINFRAPSTTPGGQDP